MKTLHVISITLIIVGGLNWGLWGLFQFDLVATLFGGNSTMLSRIVYSLVGLAAIYEASTMKSTLQRLQPVKS